MEVQKQRDSSIELFRIITMLCIIAHHYVVNSGINRGVITQENATAFNSLFCLVFGWGGKTGINCFVLITGYFMCKSNITLKKFLKLFLEIEFYKIGIYFIFLLSGYSAFSINGFMKCLLPIYSIGTGFTGSYLVFYVFIPFLNMLLQAMDERKHLLLIWLCIVVGTILPTFLEATSPFTYVGWFMVLYFIASYFRLYPKKIFDNRKIWGYATLATLILSWGSVVVGAYVYKKTGEMVYFHFVADVHKLLALLTAVSAFLYFKNLNIRYRPLINRLAACALGVLMIHAHSDDMRQWLWKDVLKNTVAYQSDYLVFHAFASVIIIYIICALIDMVRIELLEKKFFVWYDKRNIEDRVREWHDKRWNVG